ncbi:GNAT family N-acetyltransferase [Dehalococcoidia bacterium]|nr:GNAT family N-acetyltransferase [Dehalococcoidia bacterium]
MGIRLENYNSEKHDKHVIANLIYESDEEMNSLAYGGQERGIKVITELMSMDNNYFSPPNIKCAIYEDEIVGVIVGFQVNKKSKLDTDSGKAFCKAMGFLAFLKKMPLFLRMAKITSGKMDENGYYIHTISVGPTHQGCGFGTGMIEMLAEQQNKLYLHVNINKQRAQNFYKKVGFRPRSKDTIILKGKEIGTYLMEKE